MFKWFKKLFGGNEEEKQSNKESGIMTGSEMTDSAGQNSEINRTEEEQN